MNTNSILNTDDQFPLEIYKNIYRNLFTNNGIPYGYRTRLENHRVHIFRNINHFHDYIDWYNLSDDAKNRADKWFNTGTVTAGGKSKKSKKTKKTKMSRKTRKTRKV